MEWNTCEIVMQRLENLVRERAVFEARYGAGAAEDLEALPPMFSLFYRLTFELEVSPEARGMAGMLAVYIAEAHDFCGEFNRGVEGLIDDLWLACQGLNRLAQRVPVAVLQRYWRSELPFFGVLERCRDLRALEAHVPPRVLERLERFLG